MTAGKIRCKIHCYIRCEFQPLDAEVSTDDHVDPEMEPDVALSTPNVHMEVENGPEYGPHRKSSREEDQYEFLYEIKMVTERKFVCSLDLFLDLFVGWGFVEHQVAVKSLRSRIILWVPLCCQHHKPSRACLKVCLI